MSSIPEAATRIANEMAAEMRRKLEDATPEELGWPDMTPDELVAAEWRCWVEAEERRKATRNGEAE